jgi:serine/threonine protein kinase
MAKRFDHQARTVLGSWELIEPLNAGGNAEVWKARHSDGTVSAVKILYTRNPQAEPYKRFRDEIAFLRTIGDFPGVLPILDASLPEQPSRRSPAWLAMPLATPITEALGDSPDIRTVVEAIAEIAETLATLAQKGVSHRDIKPGNLYSLNEKWMIGDFGLVEYPDKEPLTAEGKTLGPLYFMPPEMISNPKDAHGAPADVYMLAKTLWVLATGQTYPPQGEQRTDIPQATIAHYIQHSWIGVLDRLISNATRHDPERRPNMPDFARELRTWLAPIPEPASPTDLSDLARRIGDLLEPRKREDESRAEIVRLGRTAYARLANGTEHTASEFNKATHSNHPPQDYCRILLRLFKTPEYIGSPDLLWSGDYCMQASARGISGLPVQLHGAVGIEIFADGSLHLMAAYIIFFEGESEEVPWEQEHTVRVGSADEQPAINDLLDGLAKNLRLAVEQYASML